MPERHAASEWNEFILENGGGFLQSEEWAGFQESLGRTVWRMSESATAQKHKEGKCCQVGQTVPVHSDGAELHGDGIDLGVNQHGLNCARS